MFSNVFDAIKDVVSKVQKNNQENPNVETAHGSVFDSIKNTIETLQGKKGQNQGTGGGNFFEQLKDQVGKVQKTNEADPEVPTADKSVFDDLQAKLQKLQQENDRLQGQQAQSNVSFEEVKPLPTIDPSPVVPTSVDDLLTENMKSPPPASSPQGTAAMTNSGGGSLGIRNAPDMGSPTKSVRIPDMTLIQVLKYSENRINLDGKDCRWALIDFNGEQGWVPEIYLNFN